MSVTQTRFGTMPDGEEVLCYTITNQSGASASFLTYGAAWQSMLVPDRSGKLRDVVLGYDTLEEYRTQKGYLGAVIGRVANRISNARFTLNGKEYLLFANNNKACLHGGKEGFDKKNWRAVADGDSIVFSLLSPDGDQNFPGSLSVMVTYTLSEDNALSIRYLASTDADTIVSLTNHAYFNLAGQGEGTVLGQTLMIDADRFTCIDREIVPTGVIEPVEGSPLDFTTAKPIGRDIESKQENMDAARGYDHNFVLNHKNGGLELACRAADPQGGVVMETYTDQPGVQLFTAYDFEGRPGKNGKTYGFRPSFCLETQRFADAMAHPDFPSVVLHAGEIFASETVYRFSVAR
ncbi:MAG TPA: aldose epimerase family protein [Eubacteriales bacterium]|nr:aldose epimerase family protein [Eubacteriales bacterium]